MCQKFTPEQLKNMDMQTKDSIIFQRQDRPDKLRHDYENLIEQIHLANQQRFGRRTEKQDEIAGLIITGLFEPPVRTLRARQKL